MVFSISHRIDIHVLGHVPPSLTTVRRLIAVHGPCADERLHSVARTRNNVHLLRRRTTKSSVVIHTNVKHFEIFYDRWCSCIRRGIYLGRGVHGDATSGDERSTLVLGPTRSGKTTSIIVPNLLMTTHSCVVTSTKNDVVSVMARASRWCNVALRSVRNSRNTTWCAPSGIFTSKTIFNLGWRCFGRAEPS